ncbi:MAG: response regulator [Gammaproteobacteria bacterium]|nr:MAG: response regulator [Gammaproteobacteria bacterium]
MSMPMHKMPRILVIDDDEMHNLLLCRFLKSKGFEAIPVHSIEESKQILRRDDNIDLLVLDYQLNDGVGLELLALDVRSSFLSIAPVIMMSGRCEDDFLEQCFVCGVNDYLIKPVNLSLLALKVQSLVTSAGMQRIIRQQKDALEIFKAEATREEQIAKFTYEYLLRQNSYNYDGVDVWLKSFSAFSGDVALVKKSPSGNLYFILADATGHGLAAAITILPVVTIFNSMVAKGFHIQKIVSEINRKLVLDTPADRFVAAVVVEINPFKRSLNVWNGAMPPVFWVHEGQVIHQFNSDHMALGIMNENSFDATLTTIDLPHNGFLFAYSDGLSEQENAHLEHFASDRIIETIAAQPANLLTDLSHRLQAHAGSDNYKDDVSVCVIQPSLVFGDLNDSALQKNNQLPSIINNFEWAVKLSGRQLESCELPPLCNHFLDQLGVDYILRKKIFAVLAEMVSNALDHGILGLSSAIKIKPNGFIHYFYEREEQLKKLNDKDSIKISIQWIPFESEGQLILEVEDSGAGYDYNNLPNSSYGGRGYSLIKQLSESIEIIAPGNKIRASIK